MFSFVYEALESQQATAIGSTSPKNRFPLLSIACAVPCVPLVPISLNNLGLLSAFASQAVELSNTLNGTELSVKLAKEWKYSTRSLVGPLLDSLLFIII